MYTVYDSIFDDFPARNTVYTPYIFGFWPTLCMLCMRVKQCVILIARVLCVANVLCISFCRRLVLAYLRQNCMNQFTSLELRCCSAPALWHYHICEIACINLPPLNSVAVVLLLSGTTMFASTCRAFASTEIWHHNICINLQSVCIKREFASTCRESAAASTCAERCLHQDTHTRFAWVRPVLTCRESLHRPVEEWWV